jgi:tRNA(Ile)-lysidine synthase
VSDLIDAVEQAIGQRRLLRRRQPVLIAVSGGLDSIVLLHVLGALKGRFEWRLTVAHFNHQLRGRASDADEEFVRETARKLRLRFVAERSDVVAYARVGKLSVEMAARRLRHEFLARTARRLQINSVALAHHADDQVELFFLRLLRGAGGEGLAGMKWRGPSPSDPRIQLVRPFLDQTKSALRNFAAANGIGFREDATNAGLDILRNRLRNKLLPSLARDYQPALAATTLRVMEIVGADADFVAGSARQWLRGPRRCSFERLHVSVQREVLRSQLLAAGIASQFDLVEQLRANPDKKVSIASRLTVQRDHRGHLTVHKSGPEPPFRLEELSVELARGGGEVSFGRFTLTWKLKPLSAYRSGLPVFKERCEYFDAEKVGSPIVLRHWRPGDRYQPIGMTTPVKVQDLFTARRVPRLERHDRVVATTAQGEPFWVEGLRISEGFKLTAHTTRCLAWEWRRKSEVAGTGTP